MQSITAGPALMKFVEHAYRADLPVLFHGPHGIGKSTLMAQTAAALGIEYLELDLSLLEPPDLVGIPIAKDGRTVYAAPAFLPGAGTKGIFMIEELNRSPRYMQGPCLQLLTARRLNSYVLPAGWLPCAAINDAEDGYAADELDRALLSRFINVRVIAEVSAWATWARSAGIHAKVIDFVNASPGVFDDPMANPRSWHYASQFLLQWEKSEREEEMLAAALAGLVGEKWALAFLRVYADQRRPLTPAEIIEDYDAHRAALRAWVAQRHLDVVAATVELFKRHLQPQRVYEAVVADTAQKNNVQEFFADLPADLRGQVGEWLDDRGFRDLSVKTRSRGKKP